MTTRRKNRMIRAAWPVLIFLACACTKPNPAYMTSPEAGPGDVGTQDWLQQDAWSPGDQRSDRTFIDQTLLPDKPRGVDVLIVVDNSGGMSAGQQWLASDIDELVSGLETLSPGHPYRIGVVSSDMGIGKYASSSCTTSGDAGKLLVRPGCPQPAGGVSFIESSGGVKNVPNVEQALSCMIRLGEKGCGFEQPLAAIRAALAQPGGFIRPGAALAIIILSNEDDCSAADGTLFDQSKKLFGAWNSYRCFRYGVLCSGAMPPWQEASLDKCKAGQQTLHAVRPRFVDFVTGLKPKGWVSVLAIIGEAKPKVQVVKSGYGGGFKIAPICKLSYALDGFPGYRLKQFADGFGKMGSTGTICSNTYRPAIKSMMTQIKTVF